jgi:hypothetical protein
MANGRARHSKSLSTRFGAPLLGATARQVELNLAAFSQDLVTGLLARHTKHASPD